MNRNRSASRFLIVSGTYLFLIILLNAMPPRTGYSTDMPLELILNRFFLPAWLGIALVAIVCRKIKEKSGGKEIVSAKVVFGILILSVIAGFCFGEEDQRQTESVLENEWLLLLLKFSAGGMSILLISLGYFFSHKKPGIFLLILEFILWTLQALASYNSSTDLIFSGYFLVACYTLRLVFIMKFIGTEPDLNLKLKAGL